MTDEQQSRLLEQFINDSPMARSINVQVMTNHKTFKPRHPGSEAHYEDANLLSSILMGAENFCYWLRRNGYTIKKTGKVKQDKHEKYVKQNFN